MKPQKKCAYRQKDGYCKWGYGGIHSCVSEDVSPVENECVRKINEIVDKIEEVGPEKAGSLIQQYNKEVKKLYDLKKKYPK